ncbi:diaminopimelate epimerase [Ignavibacteria bacterium CHB1]|jgi:diaminopimelate epimerase|nr:MAG: diaminopimelate epimerase [Chlorobiota bacterium]KXK06445.1 MAG: diaminopimelate epimerase [Chlorobi bacterium OLB4]MBV6399043.1 Diaminopimelate epimerase [Ignavibacteria bacterium]MCC6885261.1 diaminopimelate epimerase [Ignavibacteriales bacterium]MCE7953337.1 diaminopimelate epimerase [Chlorobi bacterium CHB7]MDL1887246.1 diaminopimelate epimerase [Ignavibacteria bacterium CHB1]OQY78183.1 MAG: diaminopimelate epimerase [Ignavibacteriales bacterium UTCHB1]RIK48451.1 MAG: diaminopime
MEDKKYSGAGNKFVMLNNLDGQFSDYEKVVKEKVELHKEIDGVIFLESSRKADYKMNYYNKDGTGNALCGNGLRCTAGFIFDEGLSGNHSLLIEAVNEVYRVNRLNNGIYSVGFPPPKVFNPDVPLTVNTSGWWISINISYVDVGSPHAVIFNNEVNSSHFKDIDNMDVDMIGRVIRNHKDLLPEGANVNFIEIQEEFLKIRSYERGVEGETLACGTGALSGAFSAFAKYGIEPPIKLLTRSGDILEVNFNFDNGFKNIELSGPAKRYI